MSQKQRKQEKQSKQKQQNSQPSELQLCLISLNQLLQNAHNCSIKIVGIIKSVFSHKKYIVQVYLGKKLVIRSLKRYSQFQATYQVIKMKFTNCDIGEFPSKFQVFGKEQARKQYFEFFLNKIVKNYCENQTHQASKRLVSIIYLFLTNGNYDTKKINKSSASKSQVSSKDSIDQHRSVDSKQQFPDEKKSNQNKTEKTQQKINNPLISSSANNPNSKRKNSLEVDNLEQFNKNNEEIGQQINRNRSNTLENNKIQTNFILQTAKNQLFAEKAAKNPPSASNQFQIKFEHQTQWKSRYLKIQNSCLLIYKSKMENHFKIKIQLYRIQIQFLHREKNILDNFCQKMQFNNYPTFKQNQSIITLKHQHDFQKILIKKKIMNIKDELFYQEQLLKFKKKLEEASCVSTINQTYEGVFSPIGKVFIILHKIKISQIQTKKNDTLVLKVKTSNFQYQTKKLLLRQENLIKQGFFIPISNSFQKISIQGIIQRQEGWIRQQSHFLTLGSYFFDFSQILTSPQGFKIQKLQCPLNKNKFSQLQQYISQSSVQISFQNYSDFSSIYGQSFGNQNDGRIINSLRLQDADQLTITVDRVLRVVGTIALLIQAFWRNVYLFKYPILGYSFFSILALLFVFAEISVFIALLIGTIIFLIIYNHPKCKQLVDLFMNEFIFSCIHPSFKNPLTLSSSQIKYRKWSNSLTYIKDTYQLNQDGKFQKIQIPKQKFLEFKFNVHGKTFIVKQEVVGFFGKIFQAKKVVQLIHRMISGAVNTIQKICNLLSWVDPKRTIFILVILFIFSGVANAFLIRIIGLLFCSHRLYKGMSFYQVKHYANNRKMAVFSMRYILIKHFPQLLAKINKDKTKVTTTDQLQLYKLFDQIEFPISQQKYSKKLQQQIDKIINVYLDIEQMIKQLKQSKDLMQLANNLPKNNLKASPLSNKILEQNQSSNLSKLESDGLKNMSSSFIKEGKLKVKDIVDKISTCQSRLKLDWVAGKEGISNEFQQLKKLTAEIPVIDIWLQSLLINFVLNIPSQLYLVMKAKKNELKKDKNTKQNQRIQEQVFD